MISKVFQDSKKLKKNVKYISLYICAPLYLKDSISYNQRRLLSIAGPPPSNYVSNIIDFVINIIDFVINIINSVSNITESIMLHDNKIIYVRESDG